MADEQLDGQEEPKKKKGKLIWILLVVLLAGLGGAGWFLYPKFFGKPKVEGGEAQQEAAAPAEDQGGHGGGGGGGGHGEKAGEKGKEGAGKNRPVALAPFVVNLSDPLGRRYLKLTIMVETMNEAASRDLADQEPKVRDQVIMLLSSKSIQDLATMESKMALKADIIRRLNQILGGSKVLQVYFTEMVIQ